MKQLELTDEIKNSIRFLCEAFDMSCLIEDMNQQPIFTAVKMGSAYEPVINGTDRQSMMKHPIMNDDGAVLGSLYLGADEESLLKDGDGAVRLLKCLDHLIDSVVNEAECQYVSMLLENALEVIENGIIYASDQGIIEKHNNHAAQLFNVGGSMVGLNIKKFIEDFKWDSFFSGQFETRNFFIYEKGIHKAKGFYQVKWIQGAGANKGLLIKFDRIDSYSSRNNKTMARELMTTFDDIIGESQEIQQVKRQVTKLWKGNSTILINGESGTGKELFARVIHYSGDRREGPFIAINCAAIPDTLLESELFGYEEGAFTGAVKGGKPGKFELANNGTIFLDEIGDMKYSLQAKLLRVLQENVVERIGGKSLIPINVRIISATHEELHEKVENGSFREDLFYRLSVIPIRIPPLRDRKEDILIIANVFLKRFNLSMGKNIKGFDDVVKNCLYHYRWAGNVRELENVIEYAVNMTTHDYIGIEDLPIRFSDATHREKALYDPEAKINIVPIETLERQEIQKALEYYGNSKEGVTQAADALGISVSTLYRRIRLYGFS